MVAAVAVGAVAGGSLYLLAYSLTPRKTMRARNAAAREVMTAEYPFLEPWLDSLETTGALRDTTIVGAEGERLHAIYAFAPKPTDRTAVIVHGYTDNAVRMLMIGYLYTATWVTTSCCPTSISTGRARAGPSAWGGRTGWACCGG